MGDGVEESRKRKWDCVESVESRSAEEFAKADGKDEGRGTTEGDKNKCLLIKQKMGGLKFNLSSIKIPFCLLITNLWPSVFWNFLPFCSSPVLVFFEGESEMREEIRTMWKESAILVTKEEAKAKVSSKRALNLNIGTPEFLRRLKVECGLSASNSLWCLPTVRYRDNPLRGLNLQWKLIKHTIIGDVTNTSWLIGISRGRDLKQLTNLSSNWGLKRKLNHIMKERGYHF